MWCLGRYLPFLIGDLVPEGNPYWDCFVLLLEIMDLLFSPITSAHETVQLRLLIIIYHQTFQELYPHRSITPKMHYLVHYPDWIDRYASGALFTSAINLDIATFLLISGAALLPTYGAYALKQNTNGLRSLLIIWATSLMWPKPWHGDTRG